MMKLDLKGKDYKMIEGFVIFTKTLEVYNQRGTCLGVLPKGRYPQSAPELMHLLTKKPVKEQVEEPKEKPVKKGMSIEGLKGN